MGMTISRSIYGKKQEFDLTREELQKAYLEYDLLVAREQVERFLLDEKGVVSLDAYDDVIESCVRAYRQNRQNGKGTAEALLDAIYGNFRYMELTPDGPRELVPGFISEENFRQAPDRVCFCPHGMKISREQHGFTARDFLSLADQNQYTAEVLFRFCIGDGCSMQPQYVMKNPALAAKIRERGKQLELQARTSLEDVEHQLSWQRSRAAAIYQSMEQEYKSEPDELSMAIDIRYLMRHTKELGLALQEAALLSQRIAQTEKLHPISRGLLLSAVCILLRDGIDPEEYPILPALGKEATRTLLLTADPSVFEKTVVAVATALQRKEAHNVSCTLLSENYEPVFAAARNIPELGKTALDDLMKGAEARTASRPIQAPAPDAAREQ